MIIIDRYEAEWGAAVAASISVTPTPVPVFHHTTGESTIVTVLAEGS
jgi:hypothetical protein